MRTALFAVLALHCFVAQAAVFRCPQTYPENDAPPEPLTGATMMYGERPGEGPPFPHGWIAPNEEMAKDGINAHYGIPDDEQGWLICKYGARERVKGRLQNGQEWGQRMKAGPLLWWMRLPAKVGECTVQTREIRSGIPAKGTWTVTANCD